MSFSRVTELVIIDKKTHGKDRSLYNFFKFILACVAKHARDPQVEQMKLRSLTVRTSRLTYKELQELLKDTSAIPDLRPTSTGIGQWTLGSNEGFGIHLVHEQLAGAWRNLQASANLENVTRNIAKQGDKSPDDSNKLVEPYLHRAILAVKLWVASKSDLTVIGSMNWFKKSAIAFVEPYIRETMKSGTAGVTRGQSEVDMLNSVLLQVVS